MRTPENRDSKLSEFSDLAIKRSFSFEHQYGNTKDRLSVEVKPVAEIDRFVNISISNQDKLIVGLIKGFWQDKLKGAEFDVMILCNESRKKSYKLHIPRAVGATIIQLIETGIVSKWRSAPEDALSEHAVHMYRDYLGNHPGLRVQPPGNPTSFSYIVTKAVILANPSNFVA